MFLVVYSGNKSEMVKLGSLHLNCRTYNISFPQKWKFCFRWWFFKACRGGKGKVSPRNYSCVLARVYKSQLYNTVTIPCSLVSTYGYKPTSDRSVLLAKFVYSPSSGAAGDRQPVLCHQLWLIKELCTLNKPSLAISSKWKPLSC